MKGCGEKYKSWSVGHQIEVEYELICGEGEGLCQKCKIKNLDRNKVYCVDAIDLMKKVADGSVDMILCDLPYGTTPADWDKRIDIKELWSQFKRIIKEGGAIVLTSQQPFTSLLICSNLEMYKYNWVWEKDNATNFLNSKYQPMKVTEDICVFGKGATSFVKSGVIMSYNPQFTDGKPYKQISGQQKSNSAVVRGGKGGREDIGGHLTENEGKRYPKNLIYFNRDKEKLHPTQKPVALFEYLIKTYTKEKDLVLDCVVGSGTTAVACVKTNRDFICGDINPEYVKMAEERLKPYLEQEKLG